MAGGTRGASGGAAAGYALRLLAIMLGVFFLFNGVARFAWLTDSSILAAQLQEWRQNAAPSTLWYLDTVAAPGVPLFARLVPVAEVAAGIAFVIGAWTRLAASLAFLMVANFHFAHGFFYKWEFLTDGTGLPVLGGLLALAVAGERLPFSVSRQ